MERMHAAYPRGPASRGTGFLPDTNRSPMVRYSAALSMPVQVQGSIRMTEHDDGSGTKLTLDGAVVLAGLCTAFGFGRGGREPRLEADGFHRSTIMLIPPGEWFVVGAAAARAKIARGAPMRLRFHDGHGTCLSETYDLGPCGTEPRGFNLSFHVPVAVTVEMATDNPASAHGSLPTIGGTLVFLRGILARCLFPRHEAERADGQPLVGTTEAVAIPIGQTIRFPDQLMPRTTPERPLRSLSFLDGRGHALGRFVPRASQDTLRAPW